MAQPARHESRAAGKLNIEGATVESPNRKVPTFPLLSVHQTTLETVPAETTRTECTQNMYCFNNRDIIRNMCCATARQTLRRPMIREPEPFGAKTTKKHTDPMRFGFQNGTKQHVQNILVIWSRHQKHMPNSKPLISSVFWNCFRTRGIDTNDGC